MRSLRISICLAKHVDMNIRWHHGGQVDFGLTAFSALRSLVWPITTLSLDVLFQRSWSVFAMLNNAPTAFAVQLECDCLHEIMSRMQAIRTYTQEKMIFRGISACRFLITLLLQFCDVS